MYWGSADRQDFSGNINNQPFPWERWLRLKGDGGGEEEQQPQQEQHRADGGERPKKED